VSLPASGSRELEFHGSTVLTLIKDRTYVISRVVNVVMKPPGMASRSDEYYDDEA
jgi:hypothetical protein